MKRTYQKTGSSGKVSNNTNSERSMLYLPANMNVREGTQDYSNALESPNRTPAIEKEGRVTEEPLPL